MTVNADVVIAGGGPAGMMAGLLFARAGLAATVLEKHADFLRDFCGDTVHPSTLRIMDELGLLHRFLQRPHDRVETLAVRVAGRQLQAVDLRHLNVPAPYIAMMPQWDFLDFLADEAARLPGFTLRREAEVIGAVEENGRVAGVRLATGEAVRARLVIATDGRGSVLRTGLPLRTIGAPMDVFWFRLPKAPTAIGNDTGGVIENGRLIVMIDRRDYWQVALVIPKGGADAIRARGLTDFADRLATLGPEVARAAAGALTTWDAVKLLTVTVDRLTRWYRPGLLVLGDAAHAMSPIGGVGINLAVQDAVAAANALAGPMAAGAGPDPLLHLVEDRRLWPTRVTQAVQRLIQDRLIAPVLSGKARLDHPPLPMRLLDAVPLLRRVPARVLGLGVRPEHVRSPAARASARR